MKDFKLNFSNRQKVILLVCIAVIFLGLGISLTGQKGKPAVPPASRIPAALPPSPVPTLAPAYFNLTPATATLKKGEKLTLSVRLASGGYQVDAVDAVIAFDPLVLKVETVTPGKIFGQYPVKKIDNKTGVVQLSAAGELKEGKLASFAGEDEYGKIVFAALKEAVATLVRVDSKSICAAAGQNCLSLPKSSGAKLVVK